LLDEALKILLHFLVLERYCQIQLAKNCPFTSLWYGAKRFGEKL